jgi:hypothetical protein
MPVYVDPLLEHGWVLRGHKVGSCHMIADTLDELHAMAHDIGMKISWFQAPPKASFPHYDLTKRRRDAAIAAGAIALERLPFVTKMRELRPSQVTPLARERVRRRRR